MKYTSFALHEISNSLFLFRGKNKLRSQGPLHSSPPRGKRKREDPGNKVGWFWLRFLVGKMMLCETSFSLKPITEQNKEIIGT